MRGDVAVGVAAQLWPALQVDGGRISALCEALFALEERYEGPVEHYCRCQVRQDPQQVHEKHLHLPVLQYPVASDAATTTTLAKVLNLQNIP